MNICMNATLFHIFVPNRHTYLVYTPIWYTYVKESCARLFGIHVKESCRT